MAFALSAAANGSAPAAAEICPAATRDAKATVAEFVLTSPASVTEARTAVFPKKSLSVADTTMTTATMSAKPKAPFTEKTCEGNPSTAGSTLRRIARKKIAAPCNAATTPAENSMGNPIVNIAGLSARRMIPI